MEDTIYRFHASRATVVSILYREDRLVLDNEHSTRLLARGELMSKGTERKKENKKKPAKSLMEKRAAKVEKRNQKKQWPAP